MSDVTSEREQAFCRRMEELVRICGSASELARRSGQSESAIRKWKSGDSEPTVSRVLCLAAATGVSTGWLVSGEGNTRKGPSKRIRLGKGESLADRVATLVELCGGVSRVADGVGVSATSLRKWKSGDSEPTASRLVRLAEYCGVSVGWLATGEGDASGAPGAAGASAAGFSPEDVEGIVLIVEQHEGAQGSSPEKKAAYVRALLEWELSRRPERGSGDGSSSGTGGPGDD